MEDKSLTVKLKDGIKKLPDYAKTKKGKKAIIITVVVVLIIAILAGTIGALNNAQANAYSSVLMLLMPDELADESTGRVYYVEKNKDYDAEKNAPLDAFLFYYLDDDGNRVDVPNGYYTDENGVTTQVSLGFIAKAISNANSAKTVVSYVLVAVFVVALAGCIYVAYKIWLKKELENESK